MSKNSTPCHLRGLVSNSSTPCSYRYALGGESSDKVTPKLRATCVLDRISGVVDEHQVQFHQDVLSAEQLCHLWRFPCIWLGQCAHMKGNKAHLHIAGTNWGTRFKVHPRSPVATMTRKIHELSDTRCICEFCPCELCMINSQTSSACTSRATSSKYVCGTARSFGFTCAECQLQSSSMYRSAPISNTNLTRPAWQGVPRTSHTN